MGRRKTPQEKKRNAYEKDVISVEEYPKSKAVGRARAKAGANRAHRSKVKSLLSDTSNPDDLEPGGIPRKKVWKTQVLPLGEAVKSRLEERRDRMARRFFRHTYATDLHRENFVAYLQSIVDGRSEESHELALVFQSIIDPEELPDDGTRYRRSELERRRWLSAFFQDAPEWEMTLWNWIEEMRELRG